MCWLGAAAVALGLTAWIASIWVVSYRQGGGGATGPDVSIVLDRGTFLVVTGGTFFTPGFSYLKISPGQTAQRLSQISWWPTPWYQTVTTGPQGTSILRIPLWPLTATGGLAIIGGAWLLKHQQPLQGLTCKTCGYSRDGLPRNSNCPECGSTASRGVAVPSDTPRTPSRSQL